MAEYAVVAGVIQFDPKERDVNGQTVRDITLKALVTQKLVKVTLWPEFAATVVNKGDFVVVDGKYDVSLGQANDGSQREYINVSASTITVVPAEAKAERSVVNKSNIKAATAAASTEEPLF